MPNSDDRPQRRKAWRDPYQWRLWLAGLIGARYDGLRHFAVVEPGVLLRCGQPRVRDLDVIRAQHGLRTIVCARGGTRHPLRGRWFRKERAWCERNAVELVHMPFSDKSKPPREIFDQFVAIVTDSKRHPVLVHCEQGFHRTGILSAAFRIAAQHWALEKALTEMEQSGFEPSEKRRSLRDALVQWATTQQSIPRRSKSPS